MSTPPSTGLTTGGLSSRSRPPVLTLQRPQQHQQHLQHHHHSQIANAAQAASSSSSLSVSSMLVVPGLDASGGGGGGAAAGAAGDGADGFDHAHWRRQVWERMPHSARAPSPLPAVSAQVPLTPTPLPSSHFDSSVSAAAAASVLQDRHAHGSLGGDLLFGDTPPAIILTPLSTGPDSPMEDMRDASDLTYSPVSPMSPDSLTAERLLRRRSDSYMPSSHAAAGHRRSVSGGSAGGSGTFAQLMSLNQKGAGTFSGATSGIPPRPAPNDRSRYARHMKPGSGVGPSSAGPASSQSPKSGSKQASTPPPQRKRLSSKGRRHKTRPRVRTACTHCKRAKTKCDDQRPCARCVKRGTADTCVDTEHKRRATSRGLSVGSSSGDDRSTRSASPMLGSSCSRAAAAAAAAGTNTPVKKEPGTQSSVASRRRKRGPSELTISDSMRNLQSRIKSPRSAPPASYRTEQNQDQDQRSSHTPLSQRHTRGDNEPLLLRSAMTSGQSSSSASAHPLSAGAPSPSMHTVSTMSYDAAYQHVLITKLNEQLEAWSNRFRAVPQSIRASHWLSSALCEYLKRSVSESSPNKRSERMSSRDPRLFDFQQQKLRTAGFELDRQLAVTSSAPVIISIFDPLPFHRANIVWLNQAALNLLGFSSSDIDRFNIAERAMTQLYDLENLPDATLCLMDTIAHRRAEYSMNSTWRTKSGGKLVMNESVTVKYSGDHPVYAVSALSPPQPPVQSLPLSTPQFNSDYTPPLLLDPVGAPPLPRSTSAPVHEYMHVHNPSPPPPPQQQHPPTLHQLTRQDSAGDVNMFGNDDLQLNFEPPHPMDSSLYSFSQAASSPSHVSMSSPRPDGSDTASYDSGSVSYEPSQTSSISFTLDQSALQPPVDPGRSSPAVDMYGGFRDPRTLDSPAASVAPRTPSPPSPQTVLSAASGIAPLSPHAVDSFSHMSLQPEQHGHYALPLPSLSSAMSMDRNLSMSDMPDLDMSFVDESSD